MDHPPSSTTSSPPSDAQELATEARRERLEPIGEQFNYLRRSVERFIDWKSDPLLVNADMAETALAVELLDDFVDRMRGEPGEPGEKEALADRLAKHLEREDGVPQEYSRVLREAILDELHYLERRDGASAQGGTSGLVTS